MIRRPHMNDITLRWTASRLFVQQLPPASNKDITTEPDFWHLVRGIHRSPMDSLYKVSIIRAEISWDELCMWQRLTRSVWVPVGDHIDDVFSIWWSSTPEQLFQQTITQQLPERLQWTTGKPCCTCRYTNMYVVNTAGCFDPIISPNWTSTWPSSAKRTAYSIGTTRNWTRQNETINGRPTSLSQFV